MGIQAGQILIDRYQVTEQLGKGGMCLTFAGFRLMDERPVVIKALHFGQLQNWKSYDLFKREARTLQNISHPGIPQFLDHFEEKNDQDIWLYLVQERVPGHNLSTDLEMGWRPTASEIQAIAIQVLDLLDYLHHLAPPVIHRDIKPSNIIRNLEHIYLIDFGAVQDVIRPEGSSTIVGTFGYMAPEQFSGKSLPATDLYSLGATLVHLLSGRSPAELPQKELRLDFKPYVHCSQNFAQWLEKILEPVPERRFQSAQAAKDALLNPGVQSHNHKTIQTEQPAAPPRIYRPNKTNIQVVHETQQLEILIPSQGLTLQNLFMAGFTTFWLGFIAIWTVGASFGSIFFALFSIPFWIVGLFLARIVLYNSFTETYLNIGTEEYSLQEKIIFFEKHQQGKTQRVNAINKILSYKSNNVPVFKLTIESDAQTHHFARGLSHSELDWVQAEILSFISSHQPENRAQRLLALSEKTY